MQPSTLTSRMLSMFVRGLKTLLQRAIKPLERIERKITSQNDVLPDKAEPDGSTAPELSGQPPAHWLARLNTGSPPAHWLERIRKGTTGSDNGQSFDVTIPLHEAEIPPPAEPAEFDTATQVSISPHDKNPAIRDRTIWPDLHSQQKEFGTEPGITNTRAPEPHDTPKLLPHRIARRAQPIVSIQQPQAQLPEIPVKPPVSSRIAIQQMKQAVANSTPGKTDAGIESERKQEHDSVPNPQDQSQTTYPAARPPQFPPPTLSMSLERVDQQPPPNLRAERSDNRQRFEPAETTIQADLWMPLPHANRVSVTRESPSIDLSVPARPQWPELPDETDVKEDKTAAFRDWQHLQQLACEQRGTE